MPTEARIALDEEINTLISKTSPVDKITDVEHRLANKKMMDYVDNFGAQLSAGWSPLYRSPIDGSRVVLEIYDWTGGTGTKPATGYLGASGLVQDIAQAVSIRGLQGFKGDDGEDSAIGTVVEFTPSVPFNAPNTLMHTVITGPLAFTPNLSTAVAGGGCAIRIRGNGINTPTFSGFTIPQSSDDFSSVAGMVHMLYAYYNGIEPILTVSQLFIQDSVLPTIISRITTGTNTVELTFSKVVTATGYSGFTLKRSGAGLQINAVAGSGTTKLMLTVAETISGSDTLTLDYSSMVGDVKDQSNNALASFTAAPVTNLSGLIVLTFPGLSANSSGQIYPGDSGYNTSHTASQTLAADGWVQFDTSSNNVMLGFKTTSSTGAFGEYTAAIFMSGANLALVDGSNVVNGVPVPAGTTAARLKRVGTTLSVDTLTNGAWATFAALTAASGAAMYIGISGNLNGQVTNAKGMNVA